MAVSTSAIAGGDFKYERRDVNPRTQISKLSKSNINSNVLTSQFEQKVKSSSATKLYNNSLNDLKPSIKKSFRAPITSQPEGTVKVYDRSGTAVFPGSSSGNVAAGDQSGTVEIVYAPDGSTVYIKNIIYGASEDYGDSWVQGTLSADGTQITVPLGQSVYYSSYYDADVIIGWGSTFISDGSLDFYANKSVTEAIYTINGNTISLQNTQAGTDADYPRFTGIGLVTYWSDDDTWDGHIEWNTVFTYSGEGSETPETPTVLTDNDVMALDGTLNSYVRTGGATVYNNQLYLVDQYDYAYIFFASDGETVYMRNPIYGLTLGTWVKGTVNGDKITIPTGQYLYYSSTNNYGLVTSWGSLKPEATSDTTSTLNYTPDNAVTEVTYTISGNTVTMDNTPGTSDSEIIGLSAIWDDDLSWQGFFDWSTVYNLLPNPVVAATPADPEALEWHDSEAEEGESYFAYSFPLYDTDGNTLDPKYISYSIYTDEDEIFTFDVNTYAADTLESDLTEIPVGVWGGSYDFANNVTYFYRTNTGDNPMFDWRIGIQVHYTVDGVKNSSNIVYLEVFPQQTVLRGDVNRDGSVSIADVTTLIDHLLSNDYEDSENFSYANSLINEDETVSIADVTALIDLLLAGGN